MFIFVCDSCLPTIMTNISLKWHKSWHFQLRSHVKKIRSVSDFKPQIRSVQIWFEKIRFHVLSTLPLNNQMWLTLQRSKIRFWPLGPATFLHWRRKTGCWQTHWWRFFWDHSPPWNIYRPFIRSADYPRRGVMVLRLHLFEDVILPNENKTLQTEQQSRDGPCCL